MRYIGVDTPDHGEPYCEESAEQNRQLVEGKIVCLEKDVSETDRYDRLLRYVWVGEMLVNSELVRQGYARAVAYPPDVKYQQQFAQLEREAREQNRGLWGVPAMTGESDVIIRRIHFDGDVPQVESDEYAEILNQGASPLNLSGWRLNAGNPGQDFVFPDFVLQPGQSCRVYTNEIHPETGGLSFHSPKPIWNNKGDCGYLYNAEGEIICQKCY